MTDFVMAMALLVFMTLTIGALLIWLYRALVKSITERVELEQRINALEATYDIDAIKRRMGYNQKRDVMDAVAVILSLYDNQKRDLELTETGLDILRSVIDGRKK